MATKKLDRLELKTLCYTVYLDIILYFTTEYNNSRQNIIVIFGKYLVYNRTEVG
jgi:hypothetical protein